LKRLGLVSKKAASPLGLHCSSRSGELLSRGHNQRVQQGDPSVHAETDAFRRAGEAAELSRSGDGNHAGAVLVLQRLVRQFRIGTLVVGESRTFPGGLDWLRKKWRGGD